MEKIRINGSICLSELNELAKAGHSSFTRSQDGRIYCNFTGWANSANDDFKDFSANVNGKQDAKDKDAAILNGRKSKGYIASGRIKLKGEQSGAAVGEIKAEEIPEDDQLPF
jgi:hypothetical protein